MKKEFYDVLIIGAGGSGLYAAICAAKRNLTVAVISKIHPLKSHTVAAQGGINAALGNIEQDKIDWHIYDTLKASAWLADEDSVRIMCENAPSIIAKLEEIGVEFSRTKTGIIDQKVYGGQSTEYGAGRLARRACYSQDKTGQTLMDRLYKEAQRNNVDFYNYHYALDLIVHDGQVRGAICLDLEQGATVSVVANNTVIATGGYSQVYQNATSANSCSGDGIGLVARLGLPLQDMEFVQFHPTGLHKIGILITEAARSAGGRLINGKGERFMHKYDSKFMELAPRDVVSRAIAEEIAEGNGAGPEADHVLLDLTMHSADHIKEQLPTVFENCMSFYKLDPSENMIPVSPAAHYTMGGIPTDSSCRVVRNKNGDICPGLYAIGEAACISVHGANRLGCNSLLDLLVFADLAIDDIACNISENHSKTNYMKYNSTLCNSTEGIEGAGGSIEGVESTREIVEGAGEGTEDSKGKGTKEINIEILQQAGKICEYVKQRLQSVMGSSGTNNCPDILSKLKSLMSTNVLIFRNHQCLEEALLELNKLRSQYVQVKIKGDLRWNMELVHLIETGNMLIAAEATILSAQWRCESRGAHYRSDYPENRDEFAVHSLVWLQDRHIESRPVRRDLYRTKPKNAN